MFYSSGPKDKQLHMRWFFEIIRDGLRSSCDWQVLKELDLLNISLVMFKSGGSKDRVIIKIFFFSCLYPYQL